MIVRSRRDAAQGGGSGVDGRPSDRHFAYDVCRDDHRSVLKEMRRPRVEDTGVLKDMGVLKNNRPLSDLLCRIVEACILNIDRARRSANASEWIRITYA
jgi:hypothetical protein